jgi:hypothetical protein
MRNPHCGSHRRIGELPKPKQRPEPNNRRPAGRRHLGRKIDVSSVEQLRKAATCFEQLTAAWRIHSDDRQLYRMWGQVADELLAAQLHLASIHLATKRPDGSIASNLGDGRLLVVWPFNHKRMEEHRKVHARGWLAKRGVSPKLEKLHPELMRAMERGESFPNDFFGALWSRIEVRDLASMMKQAVANYERVASSLPSSPEDIDLRRAYRDSKYVIARIILDQLPDQSFNIVAAEDGSPVLNLDDGREMKVTVAVKDKPPSKKWRSRAARWLEERGTHRMEYAGRELWRALTAQDKFPEDLFVAMTDVQITLRAVSAAPDPS